MKKLFILSGVALIVSSSLTMAAGNNSAKSDFAKFDLNKDGQISVVEATGKLAKHFDKIDADSNDLISEAEFAEIKKMREAKKPTFADFDKNNDGSISSAEFDAAKKMKQGKRHHKVDFVKVDVNKDGQITKDEAKGRLLKGFDKIDSDANGSISTTEFAALEKMHKGKGNHKLDFGSIDANNDNQITKDEAKGRLAKHFDKVDTDANGSITSAEFELVKNMKKGKHDQKVSFSTIDANNDGAITKDEVKGRLAKHFDKVDTDANGSITSAEFELVKNMKKGKHDQKVSFSTIDANNDGAITKDEAKGRLLNNFDKIDGNADGKITAQELDAKRADRKGNKRPTFEMLDTDGNGKVSNTEFAAFQQKHADSKA